jgi:hypothetical protein
VAVGPELTAPLSLPAKAGNPIDTRAIWLLDRPRRGR